MATKRLAHVGYGMLERNRVNPENIEAQCALDATTFADGAEVGTIVSVDKAAGLVKLTGNLKGILANSERLYETGKQGLRNYHVEPGKMASVLFLADGNVFTTNTVCYDTTEFAAETNLDDALAAIKTTPLYGDIDTTGVIKVTKTKGTSPFTVVKVTTMPDGQKGIKFIVTNAAAL